MSNQNTAPTFPNPFYIQWHAEGASGGQWNGSSTSGPDKFSYLDTWTIATGSTYLFQLNTKQGQGNGYDVFAVLRFAGSTASWGAILPSDGAYVDLNPEGIKATSDQLVMRAGRLISDDPKVQVSLTDGNPSASIVWTADGWLNSDGTPIEEPIKLAIGQSNGSTARLIVQDATKGGYSAALYLKTNTRVGKLYDAPQPLDESNNYTCTFSITDANSYIVNLFEELNSK